MNIEAEWNKIINLLNGVAVREEEKKKLFEKCNKCIWGKKISNSKTYCFFPRCVK